jgi:hypothetical protein
MAEFGLFAVLGNTPHAFDFTFSFVFNIVSIRFGRNGRQYPPSDPENQFVSPSGTVQNASSH